MYLDILAYAQMRTPNVKTLVVGPKKWVDIVMLALFLHFKLPKTAFEGDQITIIPYSNFVVGIPHHPDSPDWDKLTGWVSQNLIVLAHPALRFSAQFLDCLEGLAPNMLIWSEE